MRLNRCNYWFYLLSLLISFSFLRPAIADVIPLDLSSGFNYDAYITEAEAEHAKLYNPPGNWGIRKRMVTYVFGDNSPGAFGRGLSWADQSESGLPENGGITTDYGTFLLSTERQAASSFGATARDNLSDLPTMPNVVRVFRPHSRDNGHDTVTETVTLPADQQQYYDSINLLVSGNGKKVLIYANYEGSDGGEIQELIYEAPGAPKSSAESGFPDITHTSSANTDLVSAFHMTQLWSQTSDYSAIRSGNANLWTFANPLTLDREKKLLGLTFAVYDEDNWKSRSALIYAASANVVPAPSDTGDSGGTDPDGTDPDGNGDGDNPVPIQSVTYHGVTWNFQQPVQPGYYGRFVNGDPWVVGPVTVTSITIQDSPAAGAGRNGSMINPAMGNTHGFDDRMQYSTYDSTLNINNQLPLTVQPGSSVLTSVSNASATGNNTYLQQIDVLTVLEVPADEGDFRPPYLGSDKSLNWNVSDLDYSHLSSLVPPNGGQNVPDLASVEAYFEYPWIEKDSRWTGRYFHATRNHPTGAYGREIARSAGNALLMLQLNYSPQEKEKLLIGVVQAGIDIYGAAREGAVWYANGGHNQGRKMMLLLAGKVLGDTDMLGYADAQQNLIFQEDQQTFYVTQAEVDLTNSSAWDPDTRTPTRPYNAADIGLPEWGIRHATRPVADNAHWQAIYRQVTGGATFSHAVAAMLMDVESDWNWPAFFDYYDRYYTLEWPPYIGTGANGISPFAADMYEAYR